MRRSSDRAQVEPLAALAAVLAVSAGLVVYAETLVGTAPENSDTGSVERALDRVEGHLRSGGVVSPDRLDSAGAVLPDGWHANVSLTVDGQQWGDGPRPPPGASSALRRVSVRQAPGQIKPGRLRVVLWR
jgi:hypothetical protein